MPIRIYDIAKKLGLENKEVLAKARELGIAGARVAASALDRATADFLESAIKSSMAESIARGLRGFQIGNFKAFADTQAIPIRPITLIFGANSSGKSSVIHGLLLAKHAVDTGEIDVSRTALGGESLDLGGFRQYVHRREAARRVELVTELSTDILRGNAWRLLKRGRSAKVTLSVGMPLDDKGQPVSGEGPRLFSYEVEAGDRSVLRLSRRPDGTMALDRVDEESIQPLIDAVLLNNSTAQNVDAKADQALVMEAVRGLIPTLRLKCGKFLPEQLLGEEFAAARPPQLTPVGRANRAEELANIARLFLPRALADVIASINGALQSQLERLAYLGPLRSFPARHLAFAEDDEPNWFAGGGYAWNVVRTNEVVRNAVNRWLGAEALQTKYQLRIRSLAPMDAFEQPLEEAIEAIPIDEVAEAFAGGTDSAGHEYDEEPPQFGIKDPAAEAQRVLKYLHERISEKYDELVLMDLRTNTSVTHRDVGIGVSQVLPVLVHAFADRNRIVAIEQPEIHLHPALQAELGDVFIESALGERRNTFFIETHSEHLILRIMRRIRETKAGTLPKGSTRVTEKDVSILFVEPDGARSIVREMPLNECGELVKAWPGGFFEEGLREVLP